MNWRQGDIFAKKKKNWIYIFKKWKKKKYKNKKIGLKPTIGDSAQPSIRHFWVGPELQSRMGLKMLRLVFVPCSGLQDQRQRVLSAVQVPNLLC